jgi:hypothetical protein
MRKEGRTMRILKLSAMIAVLALAAVACSNDSGTSDADAEPVADSPGAVLETPLGEATMPPPVETLVPASPAT